MKKLFTLLTLLVFLGGGKSWGENGTETIGAGSWSSSTAYSGTSVSGDAMYSSGNGGGNITGYSPSNKGVKLNVTQNDSKVVVNEVQYSTVVLTVNTSYHIKGFKLEGTSNSDKKAVTLKGVYFDVAGAGTDAFGTNIAAATNKLSSDVVYPASGTNYVSTPSLTSLDATTNIVLLFDLTSNSQMRAIFTIDWEFPGPEIETQPKGGVYVLGETAKTLNINATASAGELSYQWYSNSSKSTAGSVAIPGETGTSFTPSIASIGTTYYYCKVTDSNGSKNSDIIGIGVANLKTGKLPLSTSESISSNSFTSGDYTFASTAKIENSSRNGYPVPHLKVNNGTITITATEDAIQYIKVIGSSNGSATKITAGSGSSVIGDDTFIAVDTKDGDDVILSEVIIAANTPSAGNSVSFVPGAQSRLYVEIYGSSTRVINVEVGEYEWATYVSDKALDFTGSDVKAYIVTGHSGSAITKSDALETVAANTPLLLNASKGIYVIPVVASGTDYSATNLLKAGDGSSISEESGKTKYVLSVESEKATFLKIVNTAATVPTGKAYLEFNEEISAREFLDIDIDGVSTGIKNMKVGSEDNVYYDLQGRRVLYPTKGLYIVNGKKVVIK